jgi:ADP-ribose pyrophosphatase
MQPWKTLARRIRLRHGQFLTVEDHTVELPDGHVIENWPWVITPDYVNIVAVTEQGELICLRQTKYAVNGVSLAVVGGYLEPDEDPLAAAQRELLEETGYQAAEWISLGRYAVDGNRGAGTAYVFLALGARQTAQPDADDLEEQELLLLPRAEAEAALLAGEFRVLPWANSVGLALLYLSRQRGQ